MTNADDDVLQFVLQNIQYIIRFYRYIIIPSHNKLVCENVIKMSAVSIFRFRSTLCWQEIKILHVATLTSFTAIILPKPTAV